MDEVKQDYEALAWAWLDEMVGAICDEEPADIAYSADQMVDAFLAGRASRPAPSEGLAGGHLPFPSEDGTRGVGGSEDVARKLARKIVKCITTGVWREGQIIDMCLAALSQQDAMREALELALEANARGDWRRNAELIRQALARTGDA